MATVWIGNDFIEEVLFKWILKTECCRKTSTCVEKSLTFQEKKKSVPFMMALTHILKPRYITLEDEDI